MQNRQNCDPNGIIYHCNSLIFNGDEQMDVENAHFHSGPLENEPYLESSHKNNILFDRLDLLAVDSLCTISRGSLDIAPDAPSMDINTNIEEDMPSTLKSSHKSFIFQERQDEEECERSMIAKTELMTLKTSEDEVKEDIFDEYTPKKHRPLMKNQRHKTHYIKNVKHLIRELKREHKYQDKIIADIVVIQNNKISKIKAVNIQPIISEKGHLSGLVVRNKETQFKIKVVNTKIDTFQPRLQLWDEAQETWNQFEFKIKIRSA